MTDLAAPSWSIVADGLADTRRQRGPPRSEPILPVESDPHCAVGRDVHSSDLLPRSVARTKSVKHRPPRHLRQHGRSGGPQAATARLGEAACFAALASNSYKLHHRMLRRSPCPRSVSTTSRFPWTGSGRARASFDAPFGHAGHRLHEWVFPTQFGRSVIMNQSGGTPGVDNAFAERLNAGFGAEIMGRGKFGPHTGPWTDLGTEDEWRGWWGPNPPFHTPVFVLTHHSHPSIEMEGGTLFHFVDASPQEALDLAREAAGDLDVRIGGGPTLVRDFLSADLIDALHVVMVPILLGRGVRLWDGLEGIEDRYNLEAVSSPSGVTHLTFTRR